jgi:hypothetical protein
MTFTRYHFKKLKGYGMDDIIGILDLLTMGCKRNKNQQRKAGIEWGAVEEEMISNNTL